MDIKLLDCTLRDGGHVNQGNFGRKNIKSIIHDLIKSKVDIIELGFLRDGEFTCNQTLYNYIEEVYSLLPDNIGSQEFSLMIRPDQYDINKITKCNGKIKNIRVAFYYRDIELTEKYCEHLKSLGYRVYLNPINVMGYSDNEIVVLLNDVNKIQPFALTIVDTFGSIMQDDLIRIYKIYEDYLSSNISIGLHLHENMSLAFSLTQNFIKIKKPQRKVIIDGSIYGMGRIPGNLCMEVLMDFMVEKYDYDYNIMPILHAISNYIIPIKEINPWGYSPAYYLTAKMKMHRSYAEYLLKKDDIKLMDIEKILRKVVTKEKRNFYDSNYIEELYNEYKYKSI